MQSGHELNIAVVITLTSFIMSLMNEYEWNKKYPDYTYMNYTCCT